MGSIYLHEPDRINIQMLAIKKNSKQLFLTGKHYCLYFLFWKRGMHLCTDRRTSVWDKNRHFSVQCRTRSSRELDRLPTKSISPCKAHELYSPYRGTSVPNIQTLRPDVKLLAYNHSCFMFHIKQLLIYWRNYLYRCC